MPKPVTSGSAGGDVDPTYRLVMELLERMVALDGKVDALVRRTFVDRAPLSIHERLSADRFPGLSASAQSGYLMALFGEVGAGDRQFVALGSDDKGGVCGFLALELGWSGLIADGNGGVIHELDGLLHGSRAIPVVWTVDPQTVDAFLAERGVSGSPDLLAIELNGPEYWIWEAITVCRPRVAVMAYNSAFGVTPAVTTPYLLAVDPRSLKGPDRLYYGASLEALARLSARKGYRLVSADGVGGTAVFLRSDVAPHIPAQTVERAFRWTPRHRRQLQKIGDVIAYLGERGLPLTTIA